MSEMQRSGQDQLRLPQQQFLDMSERMMRAGARLWDIQMKAARDFMEMQARSAAAFGVPDFSRLLHSSGNDDEAWFSASIDQAMDSFRRTNDAFAEVQRDLGEIIERQALGMTQTMREGMDQFSAITERTLREIGQTATRVGEGAAEMAHDLQAGIQDAAIQTEGRRTRTSTGAEAQGEAPSQIPPYVPAAASGRSEEKSRRRPM